jgi:uncharacterized protein YndB with AHSA1/START domain
MDEIAIRLRFAAPRDRVFDALSDHERFLSNARTRTVISRPGEPDKNGKGCLRTVRTQPGIRFVEEITEWERPSSYEYWIRESSVPMRHHGGKLTFTEEGGGTVVDWTTRFEIPVPVVGGLLEKAAKRALTRAFEEFLREAKARVEPSQ